MMALLRPKPSRVDQDEGPLSGYAATQKETKPKLEFHHKGLGAPTSLLPRGCAGEDEGGGTSKLRRGSW